MDLDQFTKTLPKAEVHLHLAGALKADTFLKLARKNSVALPQFGEVDELYRYDNLVDFLHIYDLVARSVVRTAHAGEGVPAANVRHALDLLSVESIDHGYRVIEDAGLVARCIDEGTAFTACPSSRFILTHWRDLTAADHPIRTMLPVSSLWSIPMTRRCCRQSSPGIPTACLHHVARSRDACAAGAQFS